MIKELSTEQLAILIPITIAVVQGIKIKFNFSGVNATLLSVLVALCGYLYLMFYDINIIRVVGQIITLIFAVLGIYDFIPTKTKTSEEMALNDNTNGDNI